MSSTRKWVALSLFHPCLARLKITPNSLRDFDGFVRGVVGGLNAIDDVSLAIGGEVGVEFEHGGAGGNGFRAVNLDLVVALCMGEGNGRDEGEAEDAEVGEKQFQKNALL
jgi:hypothetical protein